MIIQYWRASTPSKWFFLHKPRVDPHDWSGTVIRAGAFVLWIKEL